MYQKHIIYAALVSIKYLFNIEHEISEQLIIVFILSIVCFKQILAEFAHNISLQAEEAATFVKYSIGCMKEQMQKKDDTYNLQPSISNI